MRKQLPAELYADETYTIVPSLCAEKTETEAPWAVPDEGQLSLDISETEDSFLIIAPIAGVRPEDIKVAVSHDTVTVKGKRDACKEAAGGDYLLKECHWGAFSRTVVLPGAISAERAQAVLSSGVLTVTLPKSESEALLAVSEIE